MCHLTGLHPLPGDTLISAQLPFVCQSSVWKLQGDGLHYSSCTASSFLPRGPVTWLVSQTLGVLEPLRSWPNQAIQILFSKTSKQELGLVRSELNFTFISLRLCHLLEGIHIQGVESDVHYEMVVRNEVPVPAVVAPMGICLQKAGTFQMQDLLLVLKPEFIGRFLHYRSAEAQDVALNHLSFLFTEFLFTTSWKEKEGLFSQAAGNNSTAPS